MTIVHFFQYIWSVTPWFVYLAVAVAMCPIIVHDERAARKDRQDVQSSRDHEGNM